MKTGFLILLSLLLTACSPNRVIVDRENIDSVQYQKDLDACQAYAEEVDTRKKVTTSAVGSAVVGAVIGAIAGDSKTVAKAAGIGGVAGAAGGARSASQEKERVVRNCLRGRGYKILN